MEEAIDWYFTFGSNHVGLESGALSNCYMIINGTWEQARSKMFALSNGAFAFQYDSADEAGVTKWGLQEVQQQRVVRL